MTNEEVKAIRERCQSATEGPWGYDLNHTVSVVLPDDEEWGITICQVAGEGGIGRGRVSAEDKANAVFISHARADVPLLCDEVERARAAVAMLLTDPANGDSLNIASCPTDNADGSYCFEVVNPQTGVRWRHTIRTEEV